MYFGFGAKYKKKVCLKKMFIKATWLAWFQCRVPIFGDHVNNIVPNRLWVSDISTALDYSWLKTNGITHIVSVTSFSASEVCAYPKEFIYNVVFAHDNTESDLITHWPNTTAFINDAIENGGKVLVHCKFGRSRSVATVAAYLIWANRISPNEALNYIREHRLQATPTSFFVFQLYLWALSYRQYGSCSRGEVENSK